ncbi:MAG: alpha/beta hydrolase family protein [Flavobacteriales bacterium]
MRSKYSGAQHKESLYELVQHEHHKELIVFIHGFMGFMDWGAWHLVSSFFFAEGYDFCRFNLSHNGTSKEAPHDFVDLKAFGSNTYSKELFDIQALLQHIEREHRTYEQIHLVGHSRGGGMAILAAKHWPCLSKLGEVCTWAAICDIGRRFPAGNELMLWKKEGVRYIKNGRTNQDLPQSIELYQNYIENRKDLDILAAAERLKEKLHIFHGDLDESVPLSEAIELGRAAQVEVLTIKGADHVFGAKHPWNAVTMPPLLQELCIQTLKCL